MSGHSKWATIKRKKGMIDAQRGKIFQKLTKEIFIAAKGGDPNPLNNANLRMIIDKARAANMPKDKIESAIDKAKGSGNEDNYESIRYEGYGPEGVAIMVDCLTDNRNRTASFVRSTFTKRGGNLGTDGSVSYMFERKGIIVVSNTYNEEEVMMVAIDAGALDFITNEDNYEIVTTFEEFAKVRDALESNNINNFLVCETSYVPTNTISLEEEKQEKVLSLIELLEDNDDVSEVYHNLEI